jgi:hypothetical protein
MSQARRLLFGMEGEPDLARGAALVSQAADQGHIEAIETMATLVAAGCGVPQSWADAFDLLVVAAEGGSASARTQLEILAMVDPPRTGAAAPATLSRLRSSIDFASWTTPPAKRSLCEAPRVRAVDKFCSHQMCDWLIRKARPGLKTALMYDGASRKARWKATRSCSEYAFDLLTSDVALLALRARIAAMVSLPTSHMEPPQVFHYDPGEEIKPHYDFVYVGSEGYGRDGAFRSERIVSFLIYLNDEFEGGELAFPKVDLMHKGSKGDAVYFANVDVDGAPDRMSLHAGLPVVRGEKWLMSQWFHDQAFVAVL